jgi:flagellar motor component MotA
MKVIVGIVCAIILLSLGILITMVITGVMWTLIGPVGTVIVYGLIFAVIMIIRSSEHERVRKICEEHGITREEYDERLRHAELEAAAAEWRSLSKGEKISRRLRYRYWQTWKFK